MKAEDALRIDDWFCGAGGSTTGAKLVPGVEVVHAANHSALAISTHSYNYPDVEHFLADIPSMDPRKIPPADVLLASPECRARSYARGRVKNDPHLFKPGDGLDEKSRATMDEVPRFAEVRRYRCVVVENVPQLVDWCEPGESRHREGCNCGTTFRRWLRDMTNLGYDHQKVFLNSAFFPPTPQSRDRIYVVFWLRGQRKPDLEHRPACFCNPCQKLVAGVQTPKAHLPRPASVRRAWRPDDTVWGRYGQQYIYVCPECGGRAVPAITPAAAAIEWDRPSTIIGERATPLADGTMARIQRGLDGLRDRPFVVPLDRLTDPYSKACRSADENVLATLTAQHRAGLVVQVAGNLGRVKADGSISRAPEASRLVLSNMTNNVPAIDTDEPMSTVTGGNKLYAVDPWVVPLRRNGVATPAGTDPLPTIVSSGNHHGLLDTRMIVANYGGPASAAGQQGWVKDAESNPLGTHTVRDSHAILEYRGKGAAHRVESPMSTLATHEQHALASVLPNIMDCTFRMLEPSEIARGMVMHANANGDLYVIHGNRRDQVKQLGNAVTPPPMTFLVNAIKESLS